MALVSSPGWGHPEGDMDAGDTASGRRVLLLTGRKARLVQRALMTAKKDMPGGSGALFVGVSTVLGLSVGHFATSCAAATSATLGLGALGSALMLNDVVLDGACGGVAYAATDLAYGVDTLKVRMQTGAKLFDGGAVTSIRSLYEGVGVSAAFRFFHGALYMPVYGEIKHALLAAQAPLASAVLASATVATVLVSLVEVPVEALLLRVKSGRAASGFLSAARAALAAPGGLAALYCGAGPFVARHVLYESLEFLTYESLRARAVARRKAAAHDGHAEEHGHGAGLDPSEAAAMAFAAATVATVASQPLDCIRVACSLSAGGAAHAHAAHAAASGGLSSLGALQAILRARGPAGLFSGLLPRLATLAPGAVIFFSTYEATRAASVRFRESLAASDAHAAAAPAPAAAAGVAAEEEAAGADGRRRVAAEVPSPQAFSPAAGAATSEAFAAASAHSFEPLLALACAEQTGSTSDRL